MSPKNALRIAPTALLTDAGPLVALTLPSERRHLDCLLTLRRLRRRMVTTWPALTEAMYLVYRGRGWAGQEALWTLVARGDLSVVDIESPYRAAELMAHYRDTPMDLADATLVAAAEQDGYREIFSLDSDFYVYRLSTGRALEIVPG